VVKRSGREAKHSVVLRNRGGRCMTRRVAPGFDANSHHYFHAKENHSESAVVRNL
jgi:hypothetical protein